MRLTGYLCRTHGIVWVRINCGGRFGPAPYQQPCPRCHRAATRRHRPSRADISVSRAVYEAIQTAAKERGTSARQIIEQALEGVGR